MALPCSLNPAVFGMQSWIFTARSCLICLLPAFLPSFSTLSFVLFLTPGPLHHGSLCLECSSSALHLIGHSRVRFCVTPGTGATPAFSVHGILQARIVEWGAVSSSRGSSRPRDQTRVSCVSCTDRWFFTTEPPGSPAQLSLTSICSFM